MKISEIVETGEVPPKVIPDDLGGFIKIYPNPDLVSTDAVFSFSYINNEMAKFYKILPRVIGYDSFGHQGKPEPHLHIFQKDKNKGHLKSPVILNHEVAMSLFMELYGIVTTKFERDNNEKN
jgi:hypothetical protein